MPEENKTEYTDILENLKKNYLFKLSLGSKELFHSNFLEMLWELNNNLFIEMLQRLTGNGKLLSAENTTYHLSREKENFDICIYHKNGNRIFFDVIIENKVKSVPRKKQLDDYVNKVEGDNKHKQNQKEYPCAYILLSLMEKFSDRQSIEEEKKWKIVNYKNLYIAIDGIYKGNTILSLFPKTDEGRKRACEYNNIICEYKDFITELHGLQETIEKDFSNKPLFDSDTIKKFQKYRLHDLYIKLSCGLFIDRLTYHLLNEKFPISIDIWSNYDYKQIRQEIENIKLPRVFLHEEMLQAAGSVGVSICPKWDKNDENKDFYEIIIQNGQYRHCINRMKSDKFNNESQLWKEVKEYIYMLKIMENECIKKYKSENKDFCKYNGPDLYIYRYVPQLDIKEGETYCYTADMLAHFMAIDIVRTCEQLEILPHK